MIQLHFIGGWASTPLVWQEVMANLTPHLKDTPHHITYWDWDVLLDLTSSASCNFQENDRLIPGANHIWIAWSSGTLALFRLAGLVHDLLATNMLRTFIGTPSSPFCLRGLMSANSC